MPRNAEQKIKLLVLYDILQRETDEEHPLSTDVLVEKLRERGINAAGKSVVADVKTLNDWGYEVLSFKKRSYYFYTADKYFDIAELRILIDAVQAANFISEEKTSEFVDKLASIAGRQKAEQLKRGVVPEVIDMDMFLSGNAVLEVQAVFISEEVIIRYGNFSALGDGNSYFFAVGVQFDDVEDNIVFSVEVLEFFEIKFVHSGFSFFIF